MEPYLAEDGWETVGGTVVPLTSRSVKKVKATKMNIGREACIERIYIMQFMRMVTVTSGRFNCFVDIFNSTFLSNSREQFVQQLFCHLPCSQVGGFVQPCSRTPELRPYRKSRPNVMTASHVQRGSYDLVTSNCDYCDKLHHIQQSENF